MAQELTSEERRLRTIEQDLKATEAEKVRLQQRQESATRELSAIRTTMVRLADDIQGQESSLGVLENRLGDLEKNEQRLKSTLGLRDEQMQHLAMALQRMALRPTDAVTLSPLKPDDAVRAAILLRAAVPAVKGSTQKLQGELGELIGVRAEMESQQQKIALATAGLIDKRRLLEATEQDKAKLQGELQTANAEAVAKLQRLAAEASDLKDLVTKVIAARAEDAKRQEARRQEAQRQAEVAKPTPTGRIVLKPPPGMDTKTSKPETQIAALPREPARAPIIPADLKPFSQARGTMPFPVVGTLKKRYGEDSESPGGTSKGIVITTRANGQVIAPFDGIVAFAGPFRGYGLLLIIEHSEGYHTLLSGLGRIDCVLDQRVFAGEPVGIMNNESKADLYVELRLNGQPVNPLSWLNSRTGKNSG